ncbi:sensor domain-containing diguanylate cyclase [Acidaminobacter sp. JC074]|uniref:sensor domain-containing diguanylate cyclase n=1 Tax=Acidaminobacter sp. JC074 TaxID=2530199 RepID=UPI001F100DD4|nr:sensor domain-containing diguanylate cyclase [Acidaminobacter sp. JC074]MCH4888113.1 sensor domain-containing diguanylate cyclase [Acidaminobacter sp. JC074]
MSKKAKVFIKETGKSEQVYFTDDNKPKIDKSVMDKWQIITNILAKLMDARASLINRLDTEFLEIFMMSQNEKNPYKVGLCDPVGQGAYCEMVVGKKQKLEVSNAIKDPVWHDSLYVDFNFISYYGVPVVWPDGEVFGTLCVIDDKENHFNEEFQSIFREFKLSMEKDLEILMKNAELTKAAEFDALTGVYNRRKLDAILEAEFLRSKRTKHVYSTVIMDLDGFKQINDLYGHQMGDKVLMTFAKSFIKRIRKTDFFGRLGGDEFLLICPDTDVQGALNLINSFSADLKANMTKLIKGFDFSYGIASFQDDQKFEHVLRRADEALYDMKKIKKTI